MPDKITPTEFAKTIKEKYPQYKDVDDSLLVSEIIEKYPVYKDKIDFSSTTAAIQEESLKKKETTQSIQEGAPAAQGTASQSASANGSSSSGSKEPEAKSLVDLKTSKDFEKLSSGIDTQGEAYVGTLELEPVEINYSQSLGRVKRPSNSPLGLLELREIQEKERKEDIESEKRHDAIASNQKSITDDDFVESIRSYMVREGMSLDDDTINSVIINYEDGIANLDTSEDAKIKAQIDGVDSLGLLMGERVDVDRNPEHSAIINYMKFGGISDEQLSSVDINDFANWLYDSGQERKFLKSSWINQTKSFDEESEWVSILSQYNLDKFNRDRRDADILYARFKRSERKINEISEQLKQVETEEEYNALIDASRSEIEMANHFIEKREALIQSSNEDIGKFNQSIIDNFPEYAETEKEKREQAEAYQKARAKDWSDRTWEERKVIGNTIMGNSWNKVSALPYEFVRGGLTFISSAIDAYQSESINPDSPLYDQSEASKLFKDFGDYMVDFTKKNFTADVHEQLSFSSEVGIYEDASGLRLKLRNDGYYYDANNNIVTPKSNLKHIEDVLEFDPYAIPALGAEQAMQMWMGFAAGTAGIPVVYSMTSYSDAYSTYADAFPDAEPWEALTYASTVAGAEGAAHLLLPETKLFGPAFKSKALRVLSGMNSKSRSEAAREGFSVLSGVIGREFAEELMPMGVSAISNVVANSHNGVKKLDEGVEITELIDTAVLVTLMSGGPGLRQAKMAFENSRNIPDYNSLIFQLAQNPEMATHTLNQISSKEYVELLGESKVNNFKNDLHKAIVNLKAMPSGITQSQFERISPLIEQKAELREQQKNADDAFKSHFDTLISAINVDITAEYNKREEAKRGDDSTRGKEEDKSIKPILEVDLPEIIIGRKEELEEKYGIELNYNESTGAFEQSGFENLSDDSLSGMVESQRESAFEELGRLNSSIDAIAGKISETVENEVKSRGKLEESLKNTNFEANENRTEETRLDNSGTMGDSSERNLVGRRAGEERIYVTAEASNSGGSESAILSIEEREELESRGVNPDWDKRKFKNNLKEQAQKNDAWLDDSYLDDKAEMHDQRKNSTTENDVYLNSDGETVTKVNNLAFVQSGEHDQNLNAAIDRIEAHNALFPNVPYTIKGFMNNKHGDTSMVLEQPYVSRADNATQEEINEYLEQQGFKLDGTRTWSNEHQVWTNGVYELYDARPANVLKGPDGKLYFIDTVTHSVEYMNKGSKQGEAKTESRLDQEKSKLEELKAKHGEDSPQVKSQQNKVNILEKVAERDAETTVVLEDGRPVVRGRAEGNPVEERKAILEAVKDGLYDGQKRSTDQISGNVTEAQVTDHVIEHSQNPVEVAEEIQRMENEKQDNSREMTLADFLLPHIRGGVSAKSYSDATGLKSKDIPLSLRRSYLSTKGTPLDLIAMYVETEMYGDYNANSPRISEQDVIDFMNANPSITEFESNSKSSEQIALEEKFRELTGLASSKQNIEVFAKGSEKQTVEAKVDEAINTNEMFEDDGLPFQLTTDNSAEPFNGDSKAKATKERMQSKYPDAIVVQSESDLPQAIQSEIQQQRAEGKVKGVHYKGQVYMVADNIKNMGEAEGTYRHERLGHKGVIDHLGAKLDDFARSVIDSATGRQLDRIKDLAKRYNIPFESMTDTQKSILGQEYIAMVAENKSKMPKQWNDIVKFVRQALRDMGINIRVSDAEIQALIGKVEQNVKEQTKASSNLNGIRFQILGEKGAEALDKFDQATNRMDNLEVAREMETSDKDPRAIRMATGWERGADGKWKYEIEDPELNIGDKKYYSFTELIPESSSLIEAYPSLADIDVIIDINDNANNTGRFTPFQDRSSQDLFDIQPEIGVNATSKESAKSILLHEIQHAIQQIEGFAIGGRIEQNQDAIQELESFLQDNPKIREYGELVERMSREFDNESLLKEVMALSSEIPESDMSKYQKMLVKTSGFSRYFSLAGEVESRNVQSRMDMTPEQRRETLLQETEDVGREDQTIILEGLDVMNSENIDVSQIQQERERIISEAEANGTFMIAPNGEQTNLTEQQWVDVRTESFKNWFGDWENNPEESSKVIDENGEPLVVYHGSYHQFTEFDARKARQASDIPALFFTKDREEALFGYGENVIDAFLNIRNYTEKPVSDMRGDEVLEDLIKEGYDGTITFDEETFQEDQYTEFAVFNPNQVKSATDNQGTFSEQSNDIRFQISNSNTNFTEDEKTRYYTDSQGNTIPFKIYSPNDDGAVPNLLQREEGVSEGEGDFALVERQFIENKNLDFTAGTKIESLDDIAWLFRSLESEAVEHSFVVYTKADGSYTVQHLGTGGITSTSVDGRLIVGNAVKYGAKSIAFVHNHPSGALRASHADMGVFSNLNNALEGTGVSLLDGVIINLKSGKYVTFDDNSEAVNDITEQNQEQHKVRILSFSKQIFAENYNPDKVTGPHDIAKLLSTKKYGISDKTEVLILNNSNEIVGKFILPESNQYPRVAELIAQYGGVGVVIYGNNIDPIEVADIHHRLKKINSSVVDAIEVKSGNFESLRSEGLLFESDSNYDFESQNNNTNFDENNTNEVPNQSTRSELQEGDESSVREKIAVRLREISKGDSKKLNQFEKQDAEKRIALDFAKENNLWIDNLYSLGEGMAGGGVENALALSTSGELFKSNNLFNSNQLISQLLEQIENHNAVFPETAYEFVGFTGLENGPNRPPYVEVIIKQNYIPNAKQASPREIAKYMTSIGFKKVNDTTFSNGEYIVSDLYPRNVLKDSNGTMFVVDSIVKKDGNSAQKDIHFQIANDPETPKKLGSKKVPLRVAKGMIDMMKAAAEITSSSKNIFQAGIDYIKSTEWYESLGALEKLQIDNPAFRNTLSAMVKELNQAQKDLNHVRQKINSEKQSRKDAVKSLTDFINSKSLKSKLTVGQTNRLIRLAAAVGTAVDIDKAIDRFQKRYEEYMSIAAQKEADRKTDNTKKVLKEVEKMMDQGMDLDDIVDSFTDPDERKTAEDQVKIYRDMLNNRIDPSKNKDSFVKKAAKRSRNFQNRWFANQGGLLKPFMDVMDDAVGKRNVALRRAKQLVNDIEKQAKKLHFNDWESVQKALGGDLVALNSLPPEIKGMVTEMRARIDGLTDKIIQDGAVSPGQALTLEANKGQYISRTYDLFYQNKTKRKLMEAIFGKRGVGKEAYKDAFNFFAHQALRYLNSNPDYSNLSDEQKYELAVKEAEKMISDYLQSLESEFQSEQISQGKDVDILKEKKAIPGPIRKLLGEHTDPRTQFMMTMARMTDLAYQHEMLKKMKEIGIGDIFFEENDPNRPSTHTVKLASDGSTAYSPLNGLYVTPEFKKAFIKSEKQASDFMKIWRASTGAVKWGFTVGSPITHAINFWANINFLTLNGLYDVRNLKHSMNVFYDTVFTDGNLRNEYVELLIEKNIINQNTKLREVKSDIGENVEKALLRRAKKGSSMLIKGVEFPIGILNNLYQAEDDFFKAYSFFHEANDYAKAFYGKKFKDLVGVEREHIIRHAAEVTKNTLANYDRVYEGAQVPRKWTGNLVGNFLSFKAESIRTLINSVQYTIDDLKDPQTKNVGIRRLGGIMAYLSSRTMVNYYLAKTSGMALSGFAAFVAGWGDDDDEEQKRDDFNNLSAPWTRADDKMYKLNDDGTYSYYTFGNLDPYQATFHSLNAIHNGGDWIDSPGLLAATGEMLEPFVGAEISLGVLLDAMYNTDHYDRNIGGARARALYVAEQLSPGAVKLYLKETDNNPNNDFEWLNIFGVKKYQLDPSLVINIKFGQFQKEYNQLANEKYKIENEWVKEEGKKGKFKEKETLSTSDKIKIADKEKLMEDSLEDFLKVYESAVRLGADVSEINKKMKKDWNTKFERNAAGIELRNKLRGE